MILALTSFLTLAVYRDKLYPLGLKKMPLTERLSDEQETPCILLHCILQSKQFILTVLLKWKW